MLAAFEHMCKSTFGSYIAPKCYIASLRLLCSIIIMVKTSTFVFCKVNVYHLQEKALAMHVLVCISFSHSHQSVGGIFVIHLTTLLWLCGGVIYSGCFVGHLDTYHICSVILFTTLLKWISQVGNLILALHPILVE